MTTELDILTSLKPDKDRLYEFRALATALQQLARTSQRPQDLVAAGIVARRAWAALRAETEALAASASEPVAEPPSDPWTTFMSTAWAREVRGHDRVAERLLEVGGDVLRPPARRPAAPARRVTLAELAEALHSALGEADHLVAHAVERETRRARARAAHASVSHSVVDEDPGAELARVQARLELVGRATLADLAECGSRAARIGVLIAVLELARRGRARITQDDFPNGPVWVIPS